MASTSEIKARIASVKQTQKITNAMYLIASTKLRKARGDLENTRPYFNALGHEIKRIFRTAGQVESPYFYPSDDEPDIPGTYGCLVITADKGLAGSYNQNVLRAAQWLLNEHPDTRLFVVGEYGRRYFAQRNSPIERSFLYTAQNPTLARAREISSLLLDKYDRGRLKKIYVVYTDLANGLTMNAKVSRLLPFHRTHFCAATGRELRDTVPFEFVPSPSAVLNGLMRSYLAGFVYSALIDSFCSEQNARMTAMDAANQNAEELLSSLSLQFNRVRQADITQEITEVTAGAKAQKRKHTEGV